MRTSAGVRSTIDTAKSGARSTHRTRAAPNAATSIGNGVAFAAFDCLPDDDDEKDDDAPDAGTRITPSSRAPHTTPTIACTGCNVHATRCSRSASPSAVSSSSSSS